MKIPFSLWELDPEGFHIVINAKLHDSPLRMIIDTGANHSCFDRSFLEKIMQDSDDEWIIGNDEVNIGIGGEDFESAIAEVETFKIGRATFPKMTVRLLNLTQINAAYAQVGFPAVQGVLGGDFLHRHKAVIDYENSVLFLTKH